MTPGNWTDQASNNDPRVLASVPAVEPQRNHCDVLPIGEHLTPTPSEAWLLARALSGLPIDGTEAQGSAPMRGFARRLLDSQADDRDSLWTRYLASLAEDEAAAVTMAVAAVDPGQPPPEDDWEAPRTAKLLPVLPFPIEVLPSSVGRLIQEGSAAIGCPPDFLGLATLVTGGAAVGRSASLLLKENDFASANIYGANIGQPGDGKSPAQDMVTRPMFAADEALFEQWEAANREYQRLKEEQSSGKKNRRNSPSRNTDDGTDEPARPSDAGRPEQTNNAAPPILRRNVICDTTTEALVQKLEDNPRGLIMVQDELVALATSMNQYKGGKGSDRQTYLTAWAGEAIVVDRKTNEGHVPIRVPNPFLSIIGGMVPDMMAEMGDAKGRHDGFIDRFLFTYPDPLPKRGWSDRVLTKSTATDWAEIICRLQALPMQVKGMRPYPNVVHLSPAAKDEFRNLINDHHAEQNRPDFPPSLAGPWAKLERYAGRITLVLHMLDLAADPSSDIASLPDVPARIVRDASRLLAYFKSHTRRVHSAIRSRTRGDEGNDDVQCILKWLLRNPVRSFTVRDLTRDLGKTFSGRTLALQEALNWLVERKYIRLQPEPPQAAGRRGRKRTPTFLVNPHLDSSQGHRNRSEGDDLGDGNLGVLDSGDFAIDSDETQR